MRNRFERVRNGKPRIVTHMNIKTTSNLPPDFAFEKIYSPPNTTSRKRRIQTQHGLQHISDGKIPSFKDMKKKRILELRKKPQLFGEEGTSKIPKSRKSKPLSF